MGVPPCGSKVTNETTSHRFLCRIFIPAFPVTPEMPSGCLFEPSIEFERVTLVLKTLRELVFLSDSIHFSIHPLNTGPSAQHSNEDQGDNDLKKNNGNEQSRFVCHHAFNSRHRPEKHAQICEIEDDNRNKQLPTTTVNRPAE